MILLPAFVIFAVLLLIGAGRVGFWLGREGPRWRVAALCGLQRRRPAAPPMTGAEE